MFFNRESEIEKITEIIENEPNMINFVYGPINSGKTALMLEVANKLSSNFPVFYVNLRWHSIRGYSDLVEVFMDIRRSKMDIIQEIIKLTPILTGIPVPEDVIKELKGADDLFKYLLRLFKDLKSQERTPVLIVDELQKIGDLKINGPALYELFNLFIALTKETHLSHVFVVTSDSLFVERVYGETMLQGRADYIFIDDFDRDTAMRFMRELGFTEEERELLYSYFGGKPGYLIQAKSHRNELQKWCEGILRLRITEVLRLIKKDKRTLDVLKEFKENEEIEVLEIDEPTRTLIRANILFYDPLTGILRPQGRLELNAIRKALSLL
ncbi:ATP-binding protein [Pyrococcus kukulkanii]|uniref:ATP-binding protein n=1 Tax=Pyrococcus kukulkanii TaxID=1609559 RepID=A0A127B7I6_9EURY|nr:ATP-binding protein [Pyrococcus kukulkanii]AMM53238.1 ATP-binding protein [Pyrococcus kukulkanii]